MQIKTQIPYRIISLITLFLILGLTACAPKTKLTAIKPAEVSMPGVRTLAILPFKGKYGDAVREEFYSKLDEVKHFTLLDLSQNEALDRIQWEQMDDPRFAPAFEQIQADAAVAGYVTHQIKDIKGTDQVQMQEGTGRYRTVKRRNLFTGKTEYVQEEIMRTVLKPVPYIIRTAALSASIKVMDLRTRKILASKKVTETFKQKYGGKEAENPLTSLLGGANGLDSLPTEEETLSNLARKVASRLVAKIAPTKYTMTIELDKGSKGFGGLGGGNDLVKKGVEYAQKGAWEEAIELWKTVLESNPHSASALYNLGVAYEARGDLNSLLQAKKYYQQALKYGDKDIYIEAKVRIKKRIKEAKKLKQQQIKVQNTPERKPVSGGIQVY